MGWVRGINWDGIGSALSHGFLNRVEDFAPSAGWDAARPGTLSVPGTAAHAAWGRAHLLESQPLVWLARGARDCGARDDVSEN